MKLIFAAAALLIALSPLTVGAQVQGPSSWSCALVGIAATLTQCKAVPATSGEHHVITDIVVQTTTGTSGTYALQSGTGSNCGTATTALFPVSATGDRFNAPINSQATAAISLLTPIQVAANHAVCLIGVATNTISVQIHGYTTR